MKPRNLMVVQGGGPTAVLNMTLASIIDEAQRMKAFDKIFGARMGTIGLVHGNFAEIGCLGINDLAVMRESPGAILGSSRYAASEQDINKILNSLSRYGITDLLFIGGNGTMLGADHILNGCKRAGYDLRVLGVPKTIDNDIVGTDRCPGYASVARYINQSVQELAADVRSLPQPVSILETMGRSVGWIAASSALIKRNEQDAPHLVYIPEVAFNHDQFIEAIDRTVTRNGWALVVVAEGICDVSGNYVYQVVDSARDDGLRRPLTGGVGQYLAELVSERLGMRCRCEKPGLLGRVSMSHRSLQDMQDADLVGRQAVQGLLDGHSGEMVVLLELDHKITTKFAFISFQEVAGKERKIPSRWLSGDKSSIPVNQDFYTYLNPLIGKFARYDFCSSFCSYERGGIEYE